MEGVSTMQVRGLLLGLLVFVGYIWYIIDVAMERKDEIYTKVDLILTILVPFYLWIKILIDFFIDLDWR